MKNIIFIFLINLICSYDIKEAPMFTLIDLKDYYISSLKKAIFFISTSTEGNILIQNFDENISRSYCYICFSQYNAKITKNCKQYILYDYFNNDLGSFEYRTIYIVFKYISSGKLKILNHEEVYDIETRNNQEIKCFDFYPNSGKNILTYKFRLYFYYQLDATINIQHSSYSNKFSKINLINAETSENILYINDTYSNNFINLYHNYNYLLEFTPSYNDKHSLLCLSFSQYDSYFIYEKKITVPLITNSTYHFYTYLLNTSKIKGNEYETTIHFSFNNTQKKECSFYSYIYEETKKCIIKSNDDRNYFINVVSKKNDIIRVELNLISPKIDIDYDTVNTFSFYKEISEVVNINDILSFIEEINSSQYYVLPLFFFTFLFLIFLMSDKWSSFCDKCKECCEN